MMNRKDITMVEYVNMIRIVIPNSDFLISDPHAFAPTLAFATTYALAFATAHGLVLTPYGFSGGGWTLDTSPLY